MADSAAIAVVLVLIIAGAVGWLIQEEESDE